MTKNSDAHFLSNQRRTYNTSVNQSYFSAKSKKGRGNINFIDYKKGTSRTNVRLEAEMSYFKNKKRSLSRMVEHMNNQQILL